MAKQSAADSILKSNIYGALSSIGIYEYWAKEVFYSSVSCCPKKGWHMTQKPLDTCGFFRAKSPASILSRLECAYCRLKIVYIVDWKMCLLSTQKCAYCCLKSVHIVRLIRKSLPATCSSPYKAKPGSWGTPRFKILACYCQWTTQTSLFSADNTLSFIWYSYLSLKILLKCKVNTFTS